MNNGVLSQEEIDALLRSGNVEADESEPTLDSQPATTTSSLAPEVSLSDMEKDALGEMGNMSMGSAATALATLLEQRVEITTPKVDVLNFGSLRSEYPLPFIVVDIHYVEGVKGSNVFVVEHKDAAIIADLMMGNDGANPPEELYEFHLGAVGEAMNQMMGSASTALSQLLNKRVNISTPKVKTIDFAHEKLTSVTDETEPIVRITFRMQVGNLIDSEIMQILPYDFAKELVDSLMNSVDETANSEPITQATVAAQEVAASASVAQPVPTRSESKSSFADQSKVTVQPVAFAPIGPKITPQEQANIGLIMDVPLQITVELGKTRKTIKDILALGPGSVVELDKLAGEPVDLLVNGKLIAKGEVVVIDENFGVRVTDIVSPMERVANIQ